MINIVYNINNYTVTIDGHAGSADPGRDLICAAVSAIAHTLEANIQQLESVGALEKMHAELENGKGRFEFIPHVGNAAFVRHTVTAVCVGFEVLASQAGEFLTYKVEA
jgi:uncharacterized protein YsxB (DUF464 family)